MYCRKCGARIAEGTSFCTSCGERVAPLAVTVEERNFQQKQPEPIQQPIIPEITPENPADTPKTAETNDTTETFVQNEPPKTPNYTAPIGQQAQTTILPPVISAEKQEKVKTDFGKGALAFCLVVIGLLAISTGVFAGLYFSLL